ncbi:MAG: DUF1574 domain-containing protein [Leptolyngbya sp. DLM2.Bin27]|nr:MAG: DUF1574 domain-containing protein [Leptolyngbya sp. DLM2.Bin27]
MGLPGAELHLKLRGNILHVLCETPASLEQSAVLLKLVRSLLEDGAERVRQHHPQVYQLYVYSRQTGNPTPDWTAPIYLNRLERHLSQLVLENQDEADLKATQSLLEQYTQGQGHLGGEGGGVMVLSNLSLARKGDPEAIAWYLSETLSTLDVGVWVSIKAIPGTAHLHRMAIPVGIASRSAGDAASDLAAEAEADTNISRLWILCEATYSPDPSLIARPTAERLRQLQLTQYKDAVLLLQVRGETKPDWSLRIDLTPPEEMLREWGRWGDTDAIARLLSAAVASWHLGVTAELTNGTLHLVCSPQSGDHDTHQAEGLAAKDAVLEALSTPLVDLAPQGVHRAVIYGQPQNLPDAIATPAWVHYLELPAAEHGALADPPEYLGQTGDLPAIAFLLTRLLNPSLDDRLATGGQRVQLLQRDGLLHIMVDGPVAPRRRLVATPIHEYLASLSPVGVEGVRIYGRRSGQSQPAWSYGQDFLARRRLVPESTPEFTASDSYVNELLVRPDGPVTATQFEDDFEDDIALSQWVQDLLASGRRLLLRSQLLTSVSPEALGDGADALPAVGRSDGLKIAVVWAAVGLLVALQVDWLLGQLVIPASSQVRAEDATSILPEPTEPEPPADPFADLDWPTAPQDDGWFGGGFTSDSNAGAAGADLATSPSQPIVAIDDLVDQADFPTFNSQQMDEKLALYYQRLEQSGPPEVMIVGSSRALRGVDPVALRRALAAIGYDNISVFNFGINGATAQVVDLVIRQVLEPHQLPQLIIWADGARAFNSGRVDVTYNAIAASPGFREVVNQRADAIEATAPDAPPAAGIVATPAGSLPNSYAAMDDWLSGRLAEFSAVYRDRDRLKSLLQERFVVVTPSPGNVSQERLDAAMPEGSTIDFDGFLALSVRFNPATYYQNFARVSGRYDGDYYSFRLDGQQSEAFDNLLSFTQSQGIPVVFINTPLTDEYLDDFRQEAESEFLRHMFTLSTTESGFLFRDFAQLWLNRYDYFSDPSHLNRYGAYQVSNQLGQDPLISWPRPANPAAPPTAP